MSSHRERKQPRAHSDDHENVKTVLEQISFEEVSPRSVEQSYHSQHNKDQTKSSSMASNSKEDYEWQLLIVRKAVSNPHLAEQGASAGILNNDQLKSSKSDPNQRDETGFDQPNWTQQKKPVVKRNKHKRVRSNEKAPIPPMLTESSKKWNSSAQLPRDSQPETIESSDSSEEVLDNVTIIKVRRTQSSGVLAVTHRRHQSAPRQIGLTKYRRLTDPGCDVHTEEDEHVTDARTGQGLDDGVNLSDPISLAAQPRLIRVTNKAKRKNRHATQQVQKRKSRDADDDKSSSGSHYNSSDSDHERTLFELDESAGTGSGGKSEVSHATLYSKHIEPILRHTQQLMSTLHLDDDDQDEIEITKFTVQHSAEHEHAAHTALNDEERCPAPDPIAMLCGDMLSNPDSPISPSTSDDEYEDLDRAPTVNMSRAPPRASKSNLLLTRSRPKLSSEPSQSSLTVNTNTNSDSSVAPGTRPQLRVNLASIHEHREASVSQGNFFLHTDRRTFATGTSAMRQMYKTSRSLPKFHVKPVEPEHVMNVPQPVPVSVPVSGVPVNSQTQPLTTPEQSPRIKFTMSTPYLSSTQRMGPTASEQSVVPHVHSSLTTHHSLASLTNNAVIPSPRRSAFQVPARLSTPRASLTDVHSHTSTGPSVPVNSSIIINMPLNSTNTNNANS